MKNEKYYRQVAQYVNYNRETGKVYWNEQYPAAGWRGKETGMSPSGNGYLGMRFGKQRGWIIKGIPVHRLAMYILQGPISKNLVVDHINGNRKDNREANLRLVTLKENGRNRRAYRHIPEALDMTDAEVYNRCKDMVGHLVEKGILPAGRVCPICKTFKASDLYHTNNGHSSGLSSQCASCFRVLQNARNARIRAEKATKTMSITTPTCPS